MDGWMDGWMDKSTKSNDIHQLQHNQKSPMLEKDTVPN